MSSLVSYYHTHRSIDIYTHGPSFHSTIPTLSFTLAHLNLGIYTLFNATRPLLLYHRHRSLGSPIHIHNCTDHHPYCLLHIPMLHSINHHDTTRPSSLYTLFTAFCIHLEYSTRPTTVLPLAGCHRVISFGYTWTR
jgi:hypothetical protein